MRSTRRHVVKDQSARTGQLTGQMGNSAVSGFGWGIGSTLARKLVDASEYLLDRLCGLPLLQLGIAGCCGCHG